MITWLAPDPATSVLGGLRVLEIAGLGPGPFGAMLLSDFGADVIRVDRPEAAATPRIGGPGATGRNRRSAFIDLKSNTGTAEFLRLAEHADVIIDGLRPGVVERLGIGPDTCLERNPRLVYARVTGWGQDGPLALTAGHDLNYLALSGALFHIGDADRTPAVPLNLIGDYGGGLLLAFGIVSAAGRAARTGEGCVMDSAMLDAASLFLTYAHGMRSAGEWADERGANILDGGAPFYRTYRCADGRFVAVGAIEQRFYDQLLDVLGLDPAAVPDRSDRARWSELAQHLAAVFLTAPRDEWERRFAGTDACVTPVLSLAEATRHAHNVAREAFTDVSGSPLPSPAPRMFTASGDRLGGALGA